VAIAAAIAAAPPVAPAAAQPAAPPSELPAPPAAAPAPQPAAPPSPPPQPPAAAPAPQPAPPPSPPPQPPAAAPAPQPSPVAAPPAPALRPAITRLGAQVELTGYLQADAVPWTQDSLDELDPATRRPLSQERVVVRRARLRVDARRGSGFGGLELDGTTARATTLRLLSAEVGYAYPARGAPLVAISVGLLKTPFGAEVPASERDKPFLEPPAFARALIPGSYDGGVLVRGQSGAARWAVALVNGAPVDDAQWRGVDPTQRFDVVGRVGAAVAGPRRVRVEAGISALAGTGLHAGAPPTKDGLQWIDENQNGLVDGVQELQVIPGSPGTPSQTFSRDALGADAQLHWCLRGLGGGTAFAEVALATNLDRGLTYADPVAASRDLRHLGFAVGLVQRVGRRAQVGARYDRYDADRDAAERAGVDVVAVERVFSTLALMVAARWREAHLALEYDRERNPFGRDDAGSPTTRSADRVTLRAQVGF
jgi:hypothetical protein